MSKLKILPTTKTPRLSNSEIVKALNSYVSLARVRKRTPESKVRLFLY